MGNESGFAGETCWATLNAGRLLPAVPRAGSQRGQRPGTRLVARRSGCVHPSGLVLSCQRRTGEVKSVAELLKIYYESVGRGANLILNIPPDRRGQIHENDVQVLREWRRVLDATFATDLARGAKSRPDNTRGNDPQFAPANVVAGKRDTYWATDDAVTTPNSCLIGQARDLQRRAVREYLPLGQRVDDLRWTPGMAGSGNSLPTATSIGNQRMLCTPAITTSQVRLRVTKAAACPAISEMGLFLMPESVPSRAEGR